MADSRHFRAEGFGDLHGECADAARGAVDQDLCPGWICPLSRTCSTVSPATGTVALAQT